MAADSVRAVNRQRDRNGITSARKTMIQCGLSKDLDGVRKVSQLRKELQTICEKYENYFNGQPVEDPSIGTSQHASAAGPSNSA